ncbi:MAG: nucleotidyltransferase domain-containing protein [Muribaculaceae bacterium]|nr:nucleotidyltransferase domain-containing protein [Muribaculaceae bacterium]
MYLITDNLQKIIALCKKYKVKALYVFGSILTPRFNENSDVDFSAIFHHDPDPLIAGENFMNFYMDLEELMGRRIDLVDEEFVCNPYFKEELEETKQLVYG